MGLLKKIKRDFGPIKNENLQLNTFFLLGFIADKRELIEDSIFSKIVVLDILKSNANMSKDLQSFFDSLILKNHENFDHFLNVYLTNFSEKDVLDQTSTKGIELHNSYEKPQEFVKEVDINNLDYSDNKSKVANICQTVQKDNEKVQINCLDNISELNTSTETSIRVREANKNSEVKDFTEGNFITLEEEKVSKE